MTSPRIAYLAATGLLTVTVLSGCSLTSAAGTANPKAEKAWPNPDGAQDGSMNCRKSPKFVLQAKTDFNRDNALDAVYVLRCNDPGISRYVQIEVYDGTSDPAHPTRLGSKLTDGPVPPLFHVNAHLRMTTQGCIGFGPGLILIADGSVPIGAGFQVTAVASWQGGNFKAKKLGKESRDSLPCRLLAPTEHP